MIINYSSNGTYSEDGNGGYIWRRNTQDGHGGRAAEHRAEMEQIAERIADQKLPPSCRRFKRRLCCKRGMIYSVPLPLMWKLLWKSHSITAKRYGGTVKRKRQLQRALCGKSESALMGLRFEYIAKRRFCCRTAALRCIHNMSFRKPFSEAFRILGTWL